MAAVSLLDLHGHLRTLDVTHSVTMDGDVDPSVFYITHVRKCTRVFPLLTGNKIHA